MPVNLEDVGAMGGSTTTPPPGEQKKSLRRVKSKKGFDVFTDGTTWYITEDGTGESFKSQKEAEVALVEEQKKKGGT